MSESMKKLRQFRIRRQLSHLSENQLKKIEDIIASGRKPSASTTATPVKLSGIWKNKGFEQIEKLEKVLQVAREELADSITNRPL